MMQTEMSKAGLSIQPGIPSQSQDSADLSRFAQIFREFGFGADLGKTEGGDVKEMVRRALEVVRDCKKRMDGAERKQKEMEDRVFEMEMKMRDAVGQIEFRENMIRIDEKILSKTSKVFDAVNSELFKYKSQIDQITSSINESLHQNELKTLSKIKTCEELLKQRVSEPYLELLLKTHDENLSKSFNQSTERLSLRIDHILKDLSAKFSVLSIQQSEYLKRCMERDSLFSYKTDLSSLSLQFEALSVQSSEFSRKYDSQLLEFKQNIKACNKRVHDSSTAIKEFSKSQQDLIKVAKTASEAREILEICKERLDSTETKITSIVGELQSKCNRGELSKEISEKLGKHEFLSILSSEQEQSRVRQLVQQETNHVDKAMRDMQKYWDGKLVMLRREIDVHQLTKRLDGLASKNEVLVMLEEENMRVSECEEGLKKLENDMEYVANSFGTIRKYVTEIKDIHGS